MIFDAALSRLFRSFSSISLILSRDQPPYSPLRTSLGQTSEDVIITRRGHCLVPFRTVSSLYMM